MGQVCASGAATNTSPLVFMGAVNQMPMFRDCTWGPKYALRKAVNQVNRRPYGRGSERHPRVRHLPVNRSGEPMPRNLLSTVLAFSVCAAQLAASQSPVYKLLWSPGSLDTPGDQPTVILEAAPGPLLRVRRMGPEHLQCFSKSTRSCTTRSRLRCRARGCRPPLFFGGAFAPAAGYYWQEVSQRTNGAQRRRIGAKAEPSQ